MLHSLSPDSSDSPDEWNQSRKISISIVPVVPRYSPQRTLQGQLQRRSNQTFSPVNVGGQDKNGAEFPVDKNQNSGDSRVSTNSKNALLELLNDQQSPLRSHSMQGSQGVELSQPANASLRFASSHLSLKLDEIKLIPNQTVKSGSSMSPQGPLEVVTTSSYLMPASLVEVLRKPNEVLGLHRIVILDKWYPRGTIPVIDEWHWYGDINV